MSARQERKNEHYKQLALDYKNRAELKKCKATIHLESDFDLKKVYPDVDTIEQDIKTFFPD
jgi:hypothetical protein